jgi:hypothetical protein
MEILRNLFGSLTSGIIRLLVAVGILAAAYFFLIKPVLHTAEKGINSANKSLESSLGTEVNLNDIGGTLERVDKQVEIQIRRAFHSSKHNGNPKKLIRCIQRANGNVHRIHRCTVKF